jgi:hypothetical protein
VTTASSARGRRTSVLGPSSCAYDLRSWSSSLCQRISTVHTNAPWIALSDYRRCICRFLSTITRCTMASTERRNGIGPSILYALTDWQLISWRLVRSTYGIPGSCVGWHQHSSQHIKAISESLDSGVDVTRSLDQILGQSAQSPTRISRIRN